MSLSNSVITRAMTAADRLGVRTALNAALWLCGIITTPCLILYTIRPDPWLLVFAGAPEAAAIFGFLYLLIRDRPYLQSEDFQLKKMQLERIEEKGKPAIDPASVKTLPTTAEVLLESQEANEQ